MEPALNAAVGSERGAALLAALAGTLLMLALGSALILIAATEVQIGGRHARDAEVLAGTELVLERALLDLHGIAEWDLVLNGTVVSSLTDGPPAGTRIAGGMAFDLGVATSMWTCGRASCIGVDPSAVTALRPWGSNNPRWRLFAWTPLERLLAGPDSVPAYVMVWVADDPAENDGDPLRDGAADENPGGDTLVVRSEGRGGGGLRRVLEATIRRTRHSETRYPAGLERLAWREVR